MCYWCVFNVIKCWLYGLVDQIIIWCSDGRSRAPSERRIVSRQRTDEGENCTSTVGLWKVLKQTGHS